MLSLMFRSVRQDAVSDTSTPATGRYSPLGVAVSWPAHFSHLARRHFPATHINVVLKWQTLRKQR